MSTRPIERENPIASEASRGHTRPAFLVIFLLSISALILPIHSSSSVTKSRAKFALGNQPEDARTITNSPGESETEDNGKMPPLFSNAESDTSKTVHTHNSANTSSAPEPQTSMQVIINFDDVQPFTDVSTRYPHVVFSSPGLSAYSWPAPYPRSIPNAMTRGIIQGLNVFNSHSADLTADFPQPVNDLKFFITGSDNFGTIALLDYYQNGALSRSNLQIGGSGPSHQPVPIDFQTPGIKNVTRVKIHTISDYLGVSFDDFSFTVSATPTPTPTPTPSPTPPPAPTNLKAIPDEEAIALSWSQSVGATGYMIKRSSDTVAANSSKLEVITESAFITIAVIPTNTTNFLDAGLSADLNYSYVVSAVGIGGISGESESVTSRPLQKPGCKSSPTPRPNSGNPISDSHLGWSLKYSFTDKDGLKVSDIYLNGRKMAASISVPYFRLETYTDGQGSISARGELRPNGSSNADGSLYSKLVDYKVIKESHRFLIEADYAIDHIPGTPKACLNIAQQYEFFAEGFANPPEWPGPCEPSESVVKCTKFRPMVTYSFHGANNEHLRRLNIPQRHHYENRGEAANSIGLFRDRDSVTDAIYNRDGFYDRRNPLREEFRSQAIVNGQNGQKWDNIHQTWKYKVKEPSLTVGGSVLNPRTWYVIGPGCLECIHNHWRWGAHFSYRPFGSGYPLLPPAPATAGINQSVDIAVVRWRAGEEHPTDYADLVQHESIADETSHYPVVFWYSPTGFKPSDKFFWHAAWFNGRDPDKSAATISIENAPEDGPISINLGDVYREGLNNVSTYDLSTLGPFPPGYVPLNNTAYMITTEALASGPFTIGFSAASIADQTSFNNLRIFHVEPGPFDPEKPVWVDRTVLSPESPAPDFLSKTIYSRHEDLGVYAIGTFVQAVPPSSDSANLSVTCSDSPDPVVGGNQLTHTIIVTNNGPQTAHEVALRNGLSPEAGYVSATATQGTCKEIDGTVYCNLGSISVGSSSTVTVVVKPIEGTGDFPAEGKIISNIVSVRAREADTDTSDNSVNELTTALPNPNSPPTVTIATPTSGSLFVGPATIMITAIASDSDGTINKVEFYDNGELIGMGTPLGSNQFVITKQNATFGPHSFIAVATDNGGRENLSNAANVIVNGVANVNITAPSSGVVLTPASNISIIANATHPSGVISKVEFFANEESLGEGAITGSSQYSISWNDLEFGNYSIVAVATDDSGITTSSLPVNITVDTPPTVGMTSPVEGATFPSATNISVSATTVTTAGSIAKVDFFANGIMIGTSSQVGSDEFRITWRNPADGIYVLTAIATDILGITASSAGVTIGVNAQVARPGEFIWFDDSLPQGAVPHAEGDVDWYWVDANPVALFGTRSHQSRNFAQLELPYTSFHQHYFDGATATLPVNAGDKLFTFVFLDINNMPREIMLQWNDGNGWEHRAYWGQDRIGLGINGTNSRRYMGPLPKAGQWVRLEVPANLLGLEGTTLRGMSFGLDAGRATWDVVGKATSQAASSPPSSEYVWVEDSVPAGSILETVNDQWSWEAPGYNSPVSHRSFFTVNQGSGQFRSHSFRGAAVPMAVASGDVLFTYVFIDPNNKPDELVLQWHDGTSWEHRAYWGNNFVNLGVTGTESRRYMGGLPTAGQWVRLEIPASYVGLEGKSVSGMAFGFYSARDHAGINWDRAGKHSQTTATPIILSALSPVYRFFNSNYGWAYSTNDVGRGEQVAEGRRFFVHPNQAAGTVPFYRFRNSNQGYFYSRCQNCTDPNVWFPDGIAFYVFPDGSTTGTVPLHLFHDSHFRYFLTTDYSEGVAKGLAYDAIWAYVYTSNPLVPPAPSFLRFGCLQGPLAPMTCIRWHDNSFTESGFKIERRDPAVDTWEQIATVEANSTSFLVPQATTFLYRVRAFNATGDSAYSNVACSSCVYPDGDPENVAPNIFISSPLNNDVVPPNFTITANAFDLDGNGSIAKVEFYDGAYKLGESDIAPYYFIWTNASLGAHILTAVVTDAAGASAISSAVNVTVSASPVATISSPTSGAIFSAPGNIIIEANASDSDGSIANVEFFQGETKIGEGLVAPYTYNWNNIAVGTYELAVKVTDNSGLSTTSPSVTIIVNSLPSVSLTSPSNGAVSSAPANIAISADALDTDGTISKVEFFQGTTLIGTSTVQPFSIIWENVPFGTYSLTAKATDDRNAITTSAGVVVKASGPEADANPRPDGNGSVTTSDWVRVGRFVAGLDIVEMGSEFQRADCAPRATLGDARLTVADWVQAGRYAAGLDPQTPAGGPTTSGLGSEMKPLDIYKDLTARLDRGTVLPRILRHHASRAVTARIVRIVSPSFVAGQNGTVTIELDSMGDENALGLSLTYNPAELTFVSAIKGTDATSGTLNVNSNSAGTGKVGIALSLPTGQVFASGTRQIVVLTFTASVSGSLVIVSGDQPIWRDVADINGNSLAATFTP